MSQKTRITLVICTRNNAAKLELTLQYLLKLLPSEVQVLVVDQSSKPRKKSDRIKVIHLPNQKGLSKARNSAITAVDSEMIAWIDDDCIITHEYVQELERISKLAATAKQKKLAGVCGRTLPFEKTRPSRDAYCPCTFSKLDNSPVKEVKTHWKHVGYGNNMIIFKHVFESLGGFKEWLGVGSIGESGEDSEFMIRCLNAGLEFQYDHELLIFHNKWLDVQQKSSQYMKYICGGLIVYGYYTFRGVTACKEDFKQELNSCLQQFVSLYWEFRQHPTHFLEYIKSVFLNIYFFSKGIFLAYFFAHTS